MLQSVWKLCASSLQDELPSQQFNTWIKPLQIDEVNRVNKTSNDLIKKNRLRFKAIENGFYETLTYVYNDQDLGGTQCR